MAILSKVTAMQRTLYDKIWDAHVIREFQGEDLLFIDRHLIHEVTSPQAFNELKTKDIRVLSPERTVATTDHNVPTVDPDKIIADPLAREQVAVLRENCLMHGIPLYDLTHEHQGIIHVIAPELGYVQPGMTVVCGDSHTSTHGAFGALAFGIGTTEIEKILATQALHQKKAKNMLVTLTGSLPPNTTAKDIVLALIGQIGVDGGAGYVIEYQGDVIRELSMESRMTLCNMTIEAGARCGIIAPDEKTIQYLRGLPRSPDGKLWHEAMEFWRSLVTDEGAAFDKQVVFSVDHLKPQVTWGTNPSQVTDIDGKIPDDVASLTDSDRSALAYMQLKAGQSVRSIAVDIVFIGSCTNSRIEDLRDAAAIIQGRRCSPSVRAIVVPGSKQVARQADDEGIKRLFLDAGFEWRGPGCSMCVGINGDTALPGQRVASTSNRNFKDRQGANSMTHLVSPRVAAATAICGTVSDR
jgi:3-isopropylmalate/(R)-2-methylmalate dehydratase large subunit